MRYHSKELASAFSPRSIAEKKKKRIGLEQEKNLLLIDYLLPLAPLNNQN
jgi:hypothetical protein